MIGEVRVKVRLVNAVDEALVRRGQLAPHQVRVYETEALVDTGAVSLSGVTNDGPIALYGFWGVGGSSSLARCPSHRTLARSPHPQVALAGLRGLEALGGFGF